MEENNRTDWIDNERIIVLISSKFAPLLGILNTGFFIHEFSVPLIRKSEHPEKATRDVFIAYLLVDYSIITYYQKVTLVACVTLIDGESLKGVW